MGGGTGKMDMSLDGRLSRLPKSISDEHYNLMASYIIIPMLPRMIEERGVMHKETMYTTGHYDVDHKYHPGYIYQIDIEFERDKRRGFFNWLARGFCPFVVGITIKYENDLFTCTYWDYRYFQYAEDIREQYNEKFREKYGVSMVVLGKA